MKTKQAVKLCMVAQGNYILLEDFKCKIYVDKQKFDDLVTAGCITNQSLQSFYGGTYDVVLPKGITLSVSRFNSSGIYFSVFQKYNKGTGLPSLSFCIPWSNNNLNNLPLLEVET